MVLGHPRAAEVAARAGGRGRRRGRRLPARHAPQARDDLGVQGAAGGRSAHGRQRHLHLRPARAEQRHRLELGLLRAQRAPGARQVEAAPAARAGEDLAAQRRVAEAGAAAGAGAAVGQQRARRRWRRSARRRAASRVRSSPGATSPARSSAIHVGVGAGPPPLGIWICSSPGDGPMPARRRRGDALDLEAGEVGRGLVDRLLDRQLERRGRRRAALAVARRGAAARRRPRSPSSSTSPPWDSMYGRTVASASRTRVSRSIG